MKVLHLTSDWKWTGPASPMLELLLAQRAAGFDAQLACPKPPPGGDAGLLARARAAGVEPVLGLGRGRGAVSWGDGREVRRLRGLLRDRRFDVLHTWHTRDHVLAFRAARPVRSAGLTRIVRSYAGAEPIADRPWNRWLFHRAADGLLCVSPRTAAANARLRRGRNVAGAFGAVDVERFAPAPADPELRASLSLGADDRVLGIVARAQPQRRFDLLLDAFAALAESEARARLLVLGRGTRQRELVAEPARRRGLGDRVVLCGYRGEDYADVLRCIDVFTLLAPGSDGGCRALLEAAACGIPAVTTPVRPLPEIVDEGATGLVATADAGSLARAYRRLLSDDVLRATMGEAARARALRLFRREHAAREVELLYRAAYR